MNWLDWVILLWLGVVGPAIDIPLTKSLKASTNPMRRVKTYWITIVGLVMLCGLAWLSRGSKIFVSPFESPNLGLAILAWCLILLMTLNFVQTWLFALKSGENRLTVHQAFATLDFVLPQSRVERAWFAVVSLAAGVCEEILFRSFVIRLFDFVPLWSAVLISSLIFGIAHVYQGWKGIFGTFLMAVIFSIIVAGTGSLVLGMIVHTLWDLRVLLFFLPADHPNLELLKSESE